MLVKRLLYGYKNNNSNNILQYDPQLLWAKTWKKEYHTFNPDIFRLILIYCYEVNSIQHESNYIYYIQTKCCKPLATLITSYFILSEDSSWLFLSFHILYAYYLIFFWRPWLFPLWKWTIIAALLLTKSVEQKNKRVVFSMVNQQRSTLIIILHYSFLFCAWNMLLKKFKCLLPSQLCMRFVWLFWNIIWATHIK